MFLEEGNFEALLAGSETRGSKLSQKEHVNLVYIGEVE
tara:strand:+ start:926 stop:1039 length:114 start_codon:yes stop_codon:yes gene_type:complete